MDSNVWLRKIFLEANMHKPSNLLFKSNKGFPVGTKRTWNGNTYKKKFNGEWVYVGEEKKDKNTDTQNEDREETIREKTETVQQMQLIEHYTNFGYMDINDYLRGKLDNPDPTVDMEKTVDDISKGLEKLPSYSNKDVYRAVNIRPEKTDESFDEIYQKYENLMEDEDSVLEFDAFLSTTKEKEVADDIITTRIREGGSDNIHIMFNIKTTDNSAGKDIAEAAHPDLAEVEKEVLFDKNTEFEVVYVDADKKKNLINVDLKEV